QSSSRRRNMHTRPGRGRTPGSRARRTSYISRTAASPEPGLAARGRSGCTVDPSTSLPGHRAPERDSLETEVRRVRLAPGRRRPGGRHKGYRTPSRPRYVHRTDCRTGRGLLFGRRGIIALLKNFRLSFRVGNSEKPTRAGPQTYSAESPCATSSSPGLPFGRIRMTRISLVTHRVRAAAVFLLSRRVDAVPGVRPYLASVLLATFGVGTAAKVASTLALINDHLSCAIRAQLSGLFASVSLGGF